MKGFKLFLMIYVVLMLVGCSSMKDRGQDRDEEVDINDLIEEAINDFSEEVDLPLLEQFDEDFDNDDELEHMAFFGEDDEVTAAICFRESDDELEKIDFELSTQGYIFSDPKAIELEGSKKKFIAFTVSNGLSFSGVAIYELEEDKLDNILYSADPMAASDSNLVDLDDNGKFDGVAMKQNLWDFQSHSVNYFYEWNQDEFLDCEAEVLYENATGQFERPTDPESVVQSYFEAYYLHHYIAAIQDELESYVKNSDALDTDILKIISEESLYAMPTGFMSDYIALELVDFSSNSGVIEVTGDLGSLKFYLIDEGGWYIESIEEATTESMNEEILYQEELMTEDGSAYTLELHNSQDEIYDYYDNVCIFKGNGESREKVFDLKEEGLDIIGVSWDSGEYLQYEDRNLDGSKELYLTEDYILSDFQRRLIIGYFDGEFKVMYYNPMMVISYHDFDSDGTQELYGYTITGGQVSYDIGFMEAFVLQDQQYYHSYEMTNELALGLQEQAEYDFTNSSTVENINQLFAYCAYNLDEDRINELLENYGDLLEPAINTTDYTSDNMYIQAYIPMISDYQERWEWEEDIDGTVGIGY